MEIIEGPKEWSVEVTCKTVGCGVRLRVTKGDVFVVHLDDFEHKHYVRCPICGEYIEMGKVPAIV